MTQDARSTVPYPDENYEVHGSDDRFPYALRHRVNGAFATLEAERRRVARTLVTGSRRGGELVGVDPGRLREWLRREVPKWHSLQVARANTNVYGLERLLPAYDTLLAGGLRLSAVWDVERMSAVARARLAQDGGSAHHFGLVLVDVGIVDTQRALLDGPIIHGQRTTMLVADRACVTAARLYWDAIEGAAYPCRAEAEHVALSQRQRRIMELLLTAPNDHRIAELVGASVRTVRSDIAEILVMFGVTTRAAAAIRFFEEFGGLGGSSRSA